MSDYRITVAFEKFGSDQPRLISAYDEYTFDEWGRVPTFHTAAIAAYDPGSVREMVLSVPEQFIDALFAAPTVQARPEVSR